MAIIKTYKSGLHNIKDFKAGDRVKFKNGAVAEVKEDRKLGSTGVLRKRFQIVSSGSGKKKVSAKKPKKSAKSKKSAKRKPKK